ncbi:MAG: translation elongation factor Ts [SAR324 cluster bacterium]|nr:translation elongation factor Ts [SAR324 cluster bacterium]
MSNITASMVKELREISGVGMMECKKALVECKGDMEAAKEHLRKTGQAKALKKSSRATKDGGIGMFISEDKSRGALVKIACETDFVAKNEQFQKLLLDLAQQASTQGNNDFLNQSSIQGEGTVQDIVHKAISELGENIQFLEAASQSTNSGIVGGYVHMTGKIGVIVTLEVDQPYGGSELDDLAKDISMHVAATSAEAISEDQISPEILEKEKEILIAQAKESGKPDNIIEKMITGRLNKFKKEVCILSQPFVKNPDQTIKALLEDSGKQIERKISLTAFAKFQF